MLPVQRIGRIGIHFKLALFLKFTWFRLLELLGVLPACCILETNAEKAAIESEVQNRLNKKTAVVLDLG
jgi:hypothetical protein